MVTPKQTKRQGDVMYGGKYATRGGSRERERARMETRIVLEHHVGCSVNDIQTCGLLNQGSMVGLLTSLRLILLRLMLRGCDGRFDAA